MFRRILAATLMVVFFASVANAHYLWVIIRNGKANVIFEEAPYPRNGGYLGPFIKRGKTWIRTPDNMKPIPVEMKVATKAKPKQKWLISKESVKTPCAIESYGKFGTYSYKKTIVLLHYNARYLQVKSRDQLKTFARAKHLAIDIVPSLTKDAINLQVLWKGKPAANRPFYVRGPSRKNTKTDPEGKVFVPISKPGVYTFRSYMELDESGTEEGKKYDKIRHHCTLTMRLPLPKD